MIEEYGLAIVGTTVAVCVVVIVVMWLAFTIIDLVHGLDEVNRRLDLLNKEAGRRVESIEESLGDLEAHDLTASKSRADMRRTLSDHSHKIDSNHAAIMARGHMLNNLVRSTGDRMGELEARVDRAYKCRQSQIEALGQLADQTKGCMERLTEIEDSLKRPSWSRPWIGSVGGGA